MYFPRCQGRPSWIYARTYREMKKMCQKRLSHSKFTLKSGTTLRFLSNINKQYGGGGRLRFIHEQDHKIVSEMTLSYKSHIKSGITRCFLTKSENMYFPR